MRSMRSSSMIGDRLFVRHFLVCYSLMKDFAILETNKSIYTDQSLIRFDYGSGRMEVNFSFPSENAKRTKVHDANGYSRTDV